MLIVLFCLLVSASVVGLVFLFFVVRGRNKRLLLSGAHCTSSEAPEGIGISALCSGVRVMEQLENLLSVEYPRYEVIVVLDSQRYPVEFAAITTRYKMIRVEFLQSAELPVTGVRMLGRSRKRCFRRLVVVDRAQDTPECDFDAALGVATYDYVLPVREGQYLLPDAIERLVAEVGESGTDTCDLVCSRIGTSARLVNREVVIIAGGFSHNPRPEVPRGRRKTLWEPVFCSPRPVGVSWVKSKVAAAVLLVGSVAAVWMGWWAIVAVLVTVALLWCVCLCVSQALDDIVDVCGADSMTWWCRNRKIAVKKFTIS